MQAATLSWRRTLDLVRTMAEAYFKRLWLIGRYLTLFFELIQVMPMDSCTNRRTTMLIDDRFVNCGGIPRGVASLLRSCLG